MAISAIFDSVLEYKVGSNSAMPPGRGSTKEWIAKCSANQAALDRLVEHRDSKGLKDRYAMTLKRAMDSLQATPDVIATYREAKALKYVGDHIASLICPPQKRNSTPSPASSVASSTASIAQQATHKRKQVAAQRNLNLATIPEIGKKQKIYDKITKASEILHHRAKCWRVMLLIDERERESRRMASACEMSGIPCEIRTLPIADMGWIAQGLDDKDEVISELVLGTLVERKTPDDLKASLFGTRYQEQRLRLKNSGVPQILFLIEGELRDLSRCPLDTLLSAVWETRLHADFQIVQTEDMTGTVRLLKRIHRRILQRTFPQAFAGSTPLPIFMEAASSHQAPVRGQRRVQSLAEMTFDTQPVPCFGMDRFVTYLELKAKVERDREAGTRTVRNIHLAMLKQVPTFSNVKCEAIARIYPTPRSLLSATLTVSEIANIPTSNPKESQKLATIGEKSARELILVYGNSFQIAPNLLPEELATKNELQEELIAASENRIYTSKPSDVAGEGATTEPAASPVNYFKKRPACGTSQKLRSEDVPSDSSQASQRIKHPPMAISVPTLEPLPSTLDLTSRVPIAQPHKKSPGRARSSSLGTTERSFSPIELVQDVPVVPPTLHMLDSSDEETTLPTTRPKQQPAASSTAAGSAQAPGRPDATSPVDVALSHEQDLGREQSASLGKKENSSSPTELGLDTPVVKPTLHMLDSSDDETTIPTTRPKQRPAENIPSPSFGSSTAFASAEAPKLYACLSSPEEDDMHIAIERSKKEKSPEQSDLELAIQLSLQDQKEQPSKKQRRMLNTSIGSLLDDSSDDDFMTNYGRKPSTRTKPQEVIEID